MRPNVKLLLIIILFFFKNNLLGATKDFPDDFLVNLKFGHQEHSELVHVVQDYKKDVYVPYSILVDFGLNGCAGKNINFINNIKYSNISKIEGLEYQLDKTNLMLVINAKPDLMSKQHINIETMNANNNTYLTPKEQLLVNNDTSGLYLNYDLTLTNSSHTNNLSSFQDLNIFSTYGVFNQTFFGRLQNGKNRYFREKNELIRLDTSYIFNNEENITQLKIGDSISKPADWSTATRFAGIQYSTDFSIRPNIITYPLLNYGSIAALPTTLELYLKHLYYGTAKKASITSDNLSSKVILSFIHLFIFAQNFSIGFKSGL